MIEVIALDADDTLWMNEIRYLQATERFKTLLSEYQPDELIGQSLDEVEGMNISTYGYGIKSFALSMIETALSLTDGQIRGHQIKDIIDIAKEMLTAGIVHIDHAEATLIELSRDYDLMLITKGDQFEQQGKIDRSGLAKYFRYIEILGEKTKESYLRLVKKYKIDPAHFLMVGNSLRSDILPVIAMGGRAVYIPHEPTWFHEKVAVEEIYEQKYDELEHIGQLPGFIESLGK